MPEESCLTAEDLSSFIAPEQDSPEFQLLETERRRVLEGCCAGLAAKHVQLIRMRYDEGLTFLEIAQHFGVVESAVHAMHARILCAMRSALLKQGINSLSQLL